VLALQHRSGNDYLTGADSLPILSIVSKGTRHPLIKQLSRLNHEMIRMILRVMVSPWRALIGPAIHTEHGISQPLATRSSREA
jgi:hypothetical protein